MEQQQQQALVSGFAGSPPVIPGAVEEEEEEGTPGKKQQEHENCDGDDDKDDDDDDDFEFAFVSNDPEVTTADEIFYNGTILPVFGRNLFLHPNRIGKKEEEEAAPVRMSLKKLMIEEERERDMAPSCSSSESDELDGVPAESYCVWTPGSVPPSPDMKKKSKSTGFSRRWRLRDLVVGRSHSDGKKKLVFLTPPPTEAATSQSKSERRRSPRSSVELGESTRNSVGLSANHRLYYVKGGETAAVGGDQRRPYLPHRKDLVGIFASVNGTSRGFHPF